MSEATDKIIALNVRLKSSESSVNPRATSHTNVGLAQGIAHADFGFIEPALLAAIAKTAKDGQGRAEGTGRHARHPRGDGRRCIGPAASADSASLGQHARRAAAQAESVSTREVRNAACAMARPNSDST